MSKETAYVCSTPRANPKPDEMRPDDVSICRPLSQTSLRRKRRSLLMSVAYNSPADGLDSTATPQVA
jgi:hypothetical protein